MRLPVLIAAAVVALSIGYRYYFRNITPEFKAVFSWGFILTVLSIVGLTPFANFSDMIAYIIILIIVLNDGYELASNL